MKNIGVNFHSDVLLHKEKLETPVGVIAPTGVILFRGILSQFYLIAV